jgi:glutaredoxin 3
MNAPPLPVRVCPKHGLVAGRDGRCVICHRDDAENEGDGSGRRVAAWVLVAVALVGGVLVWKGTRGSRAEAPIAVRVDRPAPAVVAPPAAVDEGPAPRSVDEAQQRARLEAVQDQQRAIEAEMHKVPIRLFMIQKCETCDAARAFFKEKGLTYSELDVNADPSALEAMHKITPSAQVPVLDVDGEVLVGFGPTNLLGALRRAADRRTKWSR